MHGQAEAILVAYDIMEADGQDVRPEPLEERRKLLGEAAVPQDQGDAKRHPNQRGNHRRWGHHLSACVLDEPRRHRLEAHRVFEKRSRNSASVILRVAGRKLQIGVFPFCRPRPGEADSPLFKENDRDFWRPFSERHVYKAAFTWSELCLT
jgi:hypothetical protein